MVGDFGFEKALISLWLTTSVNHYINDGMKQLKDPSRQFCMMLKDRLRDRLPARGDVSKFINEAIEEKLEREEARENIQK